MSLSAGLLFLFCIQALTGPSSAYHSEEEGTSHHRLVEHLQQFDIGVTIAGSRVTSCEACHEQASCLDSQVYPQEGGTFARQSPYCVCEEGFVGDGVHCYDVNLCGDNNDCCSRGYRWSSEEGCVDVDECSLPEPHCAQPQTCVNTPGSFDCRVPLVSSLGSSNPASRSVQFQCAGVNCPLGQDCISVKGSLRCADPCQHHSILDDDWRATDNTGVISNCDVFVQWQGWYRMFLRNGSAQIPESCVAPNRCGTAAPLWITKPNPRPIDGIVQCSVCASWDNNCCRWSNIIHAKACFGNYYVYKLTKPTICNAVYCSEVQQHPPFISPELVCGRSLLKVGLVSAEWSSSGLDVSSAHFADPSCSASREQDGKVWYEAERRADQCGNTLTINRTHAIYSNVLFVYHVNNVSMDSPVSVPFSCVYPLDTEASLGVVIVPDLQLEEGMSGVGSKARSSMSLYQNSSYTGPYPDGPVTLPLGSALHVGVAVEETDQSLVVVLDDCYATPSSDHEDPNRHFLIQNKCPSNHRQVRVDESGSSLQGRFSALFFLFNGVNQEMFLHCGLSLCDPRTSSCSPICSGRVYRSSSQALPIKPSTIGPIVWT